MDLLMMVKQKVVNNCQQPKSRSIKECFNCRKRGHYTKDYHFTSKRKLDNGKAIEKAKQTWWNRSQVAEKTVVTWAANKDDLDCKPYSANRVFMTTYSSNEPNTTWYLDSYFLRHIYKNRELFLDLQLKNYKFIMARGEIIRFWEVRIVYFFLQNRKMTLFNVANIPKCDSNLISLGQFRKSRISYHNHFNSIIFK